MEKNYILITGATSGFGKATAEIFAKHNWNLIITGRRQERLISIQEDLKNQYQIDVLSLCFDVRNQNETAKAIASIPTSIQSKIEVLINNAGLAVGRGPIDEGIIEDWDRMIDTNIKGLLYVSQAVIPILKTNGKGHIFNIASIAGKEVYPGGNVYCATKHAVDALSKAMRIDLVNYNIKLTNIAPGAAETEFSLVRFKGDEVRAKDVYKGFEPLIAEDIAEIIFFTATRPAHVAINDITITPSVQASATVFKTN